MGNDTDEQIEEWESMKLRHCSQFNALYTNAPKCNSKLSDFTQLSLLGKGAFGAVFLVIKDNEYYAMKCISKADLVQTKQVDHAFNEKRILSCINFTFAIHLFFCFQNNTYVFFVCDFVIGGELFNILRKHQKFPEHTVKFYSSQILLALEYLHNLSIIYRDLKPENVLVAQDGYVKLADMGFAKVLPKDKRAWTLCGTPDYMAPEIIMNKGYHLAADWWSFGVFLYELSCGYPPFMQSDHIKTFEKIVSGKFKFPPELNSDVRSLIRGLLQNDLSRRFGNLRNGVSDIKDHPYYESINFMDTLNKQVEVPFKPRVKGPSDITNFDKIKPEKLINATEDKYIEYFTNF